MYRPLPDGVTIGESEIEGLGLIATKKIKAGTLIGMIHIPNEKELHGYFRTPLGAFGNHSFNPSCYKLEMTDDNGDLIVEPDKKPIVETPEDLEPEEPDPIDEEE